jgi:hypothetical protein
MLKIAVGSALLVAATHSLALSFGGTQGNVIIGRPLDMLVRGSIDVSESVAGLCLEAQLNYGDTRVPPSAITLAIQKVGADGSGLLRVRSSLPVNEPVVSLMLKAGCESSFSRTYTLLADFETTPTPVSQVAPVAPASPKTESSGPVQTNNVNAAGASPRSSGIAATAKPVSTPIRLAKPQPRPLNVGQPLSKRKPIAVVAVEAVAPSGTTPSSKPIVVPAVVAQPAARLQLDPIDLSTVKPPVPGAAPAVAESTEVAAQQPDNPVPTEEALEKMRALEQELKGLRDEQAKAKQALEAVNAQLAQAQATSHFPWLYGLGGALALGIGGFALWRQRSKKVPATNALSDENPWWVSSSDGSEAKEQKPAAAVLAAPVAQTDVQPSILSSPEDWLRGLDLKEGAASAEPGTPCSVEDLLDLVQQVDFFESLGQDADASSTLEAFVSKNPAAGEVPYLLWMRHCLERGQHDRLLEIQAIYEKRFHQVAPLASAFGSNAPGLDDDSSFMSQLSAVWSNPQAKELLEAALLSTPGPQNKLLKIRTLSSFEDLFLLHGVHSYSSYLQTPSPALVNAAAAEPTADDLHAFFGGHPAAQVPEDSPLEQIQETEALDTASLNWATLTQVPEDAPVAQEVPQPPVPSPAAEQSHLLDFDLTELSSAHPQAATPKASPQALKDMPGLDFDFGDIKASIPAGKTPV